MRLPGGFLPIDDQGFITADVQTPPEASFNRTLDAVKQVENYLLQRPGVEDVTFLTGFSFLGQGTNTAQAFVTLKDWSERGPKEFGRGDRRRRQQTLASIRDAKISALQPPPIDNLGNSTGFSFRLQDRGQRGYAELMQAKDQLLAAANRSPVLQNVYRRRPAARAAGRNSSIDREKAGGASASPSRTSTTRSRPISARPTSTTFRTAAACSA